MSLNIPASGLIEPRYVWGNGMADTLDSLIKVIEACDSTDAETSALAEAAFEGALLLASRPVLSLHSALTRDGFRIFDFDTDAAGDWA